MMQPRSRCSSSSSLAPVSSQRPERITTNPLLVNPQSASNSTAANSRSRAPVIALAPEQAVIVPSRALAGTHITQITTTFDPVHSPTSTSNTHPRKRNYDTMVAQDKVSDKRMPAQVTAQVAPTSSDSSTPHPDSHSQSQSDAYIPSQTSEAEPLMSTLVRVSTSESDSDSSVGSSAVDVDSPKGTEPQIEMEGLISLQSQEEKHVYHMTTITPPPVAPVVTPASSPEDSLTPRTPSTTAPPSDQTLSTLDIFESHSKRAIAKHCEQINIFYKTRSSMLYQAERMLIFASRGFERGNLPTRQTRPPLLKRRYSIDVNTTKNWEKQINARWLHYNLKEDTPALRSYEMELPLVLSPQRSVPHPSRYAAFGPGFNFDPPYDKGIFLELGDVVIHNEAYNLISATDTSPFGLEVWMRDESLDMALEVLRYDENCDAHSIDIANSTVAQICYFAAMTQDGSSGEFEQYKARYRNKKWIFLVCNDAMGDIENNGTSGSHWSLVALDRISKCAYYYDSLFINSSKYQGLGHDISCGMLTILGEDTSQWRYEVQVHSPEQNLHNLFKHDGGACGPFVFKMTQILVEHIKGQQTLGLEDQCRLELDRSFATQLFKPLFHSGRVRDEIKARILRRHHISRASALIDQHDHNAIYDADVVLDDRPVVAFEVPPKPKPPVLRRTHHMDRYSRSHHTGRRCSRGTNYHDPIDVDDSDDNYITYENSSDSGHSTGWSSGGDTTVIGQPDDPAEESGVDIDMDDDVNLYDDPEGGVRVIDETDGVRDEYTSATYQRTINNSPEPDDEEEGPSVTRLV